MPEGDTIHRTAARLKPVLAGKTVASFEAARLVEAGPSAGTAIDSVEAKGKYLLVHFGDGNTLETHMKMTGSWHIYRRGERWRRAASAARAVIETEEGWVAVCFSAPHVKLTRSRAGLNGPGAGLTRRSEGPDHLGPDLCSPAPDLGQAVQRFDLRPGDSPIADVLLDQRICCGVGNVYKSEVLFVCGLHPLTPLRSIDGDRRAELVTTAHRMLRQNLGPGSRTTVGPDGSPGESGAGDRLAVYGRRGLPCLRCDGLIAYDRHGTHARSSYWCPVCQPAPAAENGASGRL